MEIKRLLVVVGIIVAVIVGSVFLFSKSEKSSKTHEGQPIVSVSTFALSEVVRSVAGETVEVKPIIPPGCDAHVFSPDPKQVAEISTSALFVYNGAGFENWAEPMKRNLSPQTAVVDMSRYVTMIEGGEQEHSHGSTHHHGSTDPHYWLDIDNMIKMTRKIETELSERFPGNAPLYRQNAQNYIARLEELKGEYIQGLSACKNRVLVSNHDAFGYLAHANALTPVSVIGLSSDEQPNAKNIADIVAMVKKHGIKTVFFEEFISDNIAQTIAQETGASAISLQPLENISEDELKSHQTYLSIMRDNLAKLKDAMECR